MTPEKFTVHISDEILQDMRARIAATRWAPEMEDMGWRYGFDGGYLRELARTWQSEFDWREAERAINQFTHYRVTIDGFPIHFIREPGKGPKPIPLILTHGWPWTFWDMQKVIRPLADPAAYGGDPADAFDVIVPSLPGFTFSTPLPRLGVHAGTAADLWHILMTKVLGFQRFAAAGADWGARVTAQLGHQYASSLYGVHTVGTIPLDLFNGERWWDITSYLVPYDAPAEVRQRMLPGLSRIVSHVAVQTIEPQTLSYAMHDSPVGMLAWLAQRRREWGQTKDGRSEEHTSELQSLMRISYAVFCLKKKKKKRRKQNLQQHIHMENRSKVKQNHIITERIPLTQRQNHANKQYKKRKFKRVIITS